jgi:hypothetical protein
MSLILADEPHGEQRLTVGPTPTRGYATSHDPLPAQLALLDILVTELLRKRLTTRPDGRGGTTCRLLPWPLLQITHYYTISCRSGSSTLRSSADALLTPRGPSRCKFSRQSSFSIPSVVCHRLPTLYFGIASRRRPSKIVDSSEDMNMYVSQRVTDIYNARLVL